MNQKKSKFIPYGRQWIEEDDIREVVNVLKTDWITQGPKIDEFEREVAKFCGAKYAVAVSSGTAALHAAYTVAGIELGDEIITTPLTFAATANAAFFCGGKPVFADIEADTLNIDPKEIEKKITKKTKAIVPVDFAGQPCNYDNILKIAKKYKLLVIEDACHALGSFYKKRKVGTFGDMTILSFHPVKTIATGEGGMILTNNKDFYEKLRIFRNHGIVKKPEIGGWYYEIEKPAYNYRITDLQCALGLNQLRKIGKFIKRRREIVTKYNKAFKSIKEIIIPLEKKYTESSWHLYVIQLRLDKLSVGRKEIYEELHKRGIGAQIHYLPVHLHPFYQKKFRYKKGDFPIAEKYYDRAISLPLFPKMTEEEVNRVIKIIREIINIYKLKTK